VQPCVLFSPIGMTDPTRDDYDGPFLHILRHYRPVEAVLFFTEETWQHQQSDNRYRAMAQKLCADWPQPPVLTLCPHPEIAQAHRFEIYDQPFRQALEDLHARWPDHRLLVNISSGTPQMEASLYLLAATLPFQVIPVQVSTHQKAANQDRRHYDIEAEWNNLLDNLTGETENRCIPLQLVNVQYAILKKNILSLAENGDYSAALSLAKDAVELFDPKALALLTAACSRVGMKSVQALQDAKKAGLPFKELFEVQDSDLLVCYEYILMLDILRQRQDYNGFARAVSPVLTDLLELCCHRLHGKQPRTWCDTRSAVPKLSRSVLQSREPQLLAALDAKFRGEFKDSPLAASNLLPILQQLESEKPCGRPHLLEYAEDLRKVEEDVRNLAAHEITELDDLRIRGITGFTSAEILTRLKGIFESCANRSAPLQWNGYKAINSQLHALIR